MREIKLTVNGTTSTIEVEDRTLLADALRDNLGRTGTHIGCDTSQCGCCTVHLDGVAVKSCSMLAVQAEGAKITTIEGLAPAADKLHPVQEAFSRCHGLQCGFCTPGNPNPNDDEIREGLAGNLCRCTGYVNIEAAVREAAAAIRSQA